MSDPTNSPAADSDPKSEYKVIDLEKSRHLFADGGFEKFVNDMNADLETHDVVQINDGDNQPIGYIASPKLILRNLGRAIASGKIEGEQPKLGYHDGKIVIEVPYAMVRQASGEAILQGLLTPA